MASLHEGLSLIDRAVGIVSVQAVCCFAEARALMKSRITARGPALDEMAEQILDHVIRFDVQTS
jgi:hypothetical protein